ncbi:PEP-CTERM sorting domain-containing protein [Massilia arenosa]|uniref:PEP-CTERM sorting domain-containing protein n=1 Tax=Zemynaea arenosa TaxID=2561931 RepID=A0A4Y9SAN0_9BURK|nr:FxDxF family PEP-CTERM protein [Massilia arenosa]TFW19062.1 PEP-CTERM sorting domain-containing protein [Massilia arenosa]
MKLKTLAAAAVLALGTTGYAFADDQSFDAGSIPLSPDMWAQTVMHQAGSFTDTFTFSIQAGDLSSSANPLNVKLGNVDVFNISNLSYTIWSGSDNLGTFAGDNTTFTNTLAAGDYVVKVMGDADGAMGGTYGIAMQLAAVPEPETYAMLLAGLGLVGFMSRRRNTNEKFA